MHQRLSQWDFLGWKLGIAYSSYSSLQMARLKEAFTENGYYGKKIIISSRMSVWMCVYCHLFILCRENWKLFPPLLHQECPNQSYLSISTVCGFFFLFPVICQCRWMEMQSITLSTSHSFIYEISFERKKKKSSILNYHCYFQSSYHYATSKVLQSLIM